MLGCVTGIVRYNLKFFIFTDETILRQHSNFVFSMTNEKYKKSGSSYSKFCYLLGLIKEKTEENLM